MQVEGEGIPISPGLLAGRAPPHPEKGKKVQYLNGPVLPGGHQVLDIAVKGLNNCVLLPEKEGPGKVKEGLAVVQDCEGKGTLTLSVKER